MDIGKLEYRVKSITRYVVTRYEEGADGNAGSVSERGSYDNAEVAHEVAYALCRAEHERLGLPLGDERIQYPKPHYPATMATKKYGPIASGGMSADAVSSGTLG